MLPLNSVLVSSLNNNQQIIDNGPHFECNVVRDSKEPQGLSFHTVFCFCFLNEFQRAFIKAGDVKGQQASGPSVNSVKLVHWLRSHQEKLLSAGCWPFSQPGIYAQLSGGLFSADTQVWKQSVIGRFMASKHIVLYSVINYINNFKIIYTSYCQHFVLLIFLTAVK